MALLVDGGMNTMEELRAQDSGVLDVARGEGIDLPAKLSLAGAEIELQMETLLRRSGGGTLEQVVATAALRRWHLLLTLEMTYRDAYFSQLNDRYEQRWKAYKEEAERAGQRVLDGGVGLVSEPLRRPGEVVAATGPGSFSPATYWIQASWVNPQGQESVGGPVTVCSSAVEHSLMVYPPEAPARVSGWNIYVGTKPDSVGRQNAAPLALGEPWTLSLLGVQPGPAPGEGQAAEFYITRQRLLTR